MFPLGPYLGRGLQGGEKAAQWAQAVSRGSGRSPSTRGHQRGPSKATGLWTVLLVHQSEPSKEIPMQTAWGPRQAVEGSQVVIRLLVECHLLTWEVVFQEAPGMRVCVSRTQGVQIPKHLAHVLLQPQWPPWHPWLYPTPTELSWSSSTFAVI